MSHCWLLQQSQDICRDYGMDRRTRRIASNQIASRVCYLLSEIASLKQELFHTRDISWDKRYKEICVWAKCFYTLRNCKGLLSVKLIYPLYMQNQESSWYLNELVLMAESILGSRSTFLPVLYDGNLPEHRRTRRGDGAEISHFELNSFNRTIFLIYFSEGPETF